MSSGTCLHGLVLTVRKSGVASFKRAEMREMEEMGQERRERKEIESPLLPVLIILSI